jgi:DNA-directed RNA polymerase specialized sigma24 family protein
MPPTSFTPELVVRLRAEYESGKSSRLIAAEHRFDRATMMRHLRAAGVEVRFKGLTEAQADEAAAMYRSGFTQAQVAAQFSVSQGTVGRYLRALGVQARPALVPAVAMV